MQGRIVELMNDARSTRLRFSRMVTWSSRCKTFVQLYRGWYNEQPDKRILPRAVDLIFRGPVRTILDCSIDIDVSDDLYALPEYFPMLAGQWKDECDEKLRQLIRDSDAFKDKLSDGNDPLVLASMAFTCTKCQGEAIGSKKLPSLYPGILSHDCLWEHVDPHAVASDEDEQP